MMHDTGCMGSMGSMSSMKQAHSTTGGAKTMDGSMVMTFFSSSSTPLFSKGWTPQTTTSYMATCFFLVALACIMRMLLALKPVLETSIWWINSNSDRILLPEGNEDIDPVKEDIRRLQKVTSQVKQRWWRWRFSTSLSRATFEVLLAVVGYLLMLAVMTMNIGYFVSVIVGIFLGTFALGDLAMNSSLYEEHQC
ncbi:Ctr copper transporter family-domain-containing protein [Pseudomassariella vexata]|uniref:Copper transport protein n=1 Tax=Pseudomassariella vexata TaxID=1141098 RepID=A0A1Y2EDM0_9PEZI|nr:Ctr copper transporter family-domain-containing protein [Pseudomassariella vexata]ORY68905.1 Ctr copper transporter family-domain-containing protein [Pseudomassariella vexata]